MKKVEHCECCGAPITRHRHRLSPGLVSALLVLANTAGRDQVLIRDLPLTFNQRDNFQKLRYWGAVHHHGAARSGVWSLSRVGARFLDGRALLRMYAVTFRGEVEGYDGELIYARDVMDGSPYWDQYQDYCARMTAEGPSLWSHAL